MPMYRGTRRHRHVSQLHTHTPVAFGPGGSLVVCQPKLSVYTSVERAACKHLQQCTVVKMGPV